MENNKYYTPTKEELHIGFEVELKSTVTGTKSNDNIEVWIPGTITTLKGFVKALSYLESDLIRVKYLNQSDIESLGWKETCTDYIYTIATNKVQLRYNDTVALLEMYKENNTFTIMYSCECIFKGTIKNKSELKQLMKWLNIN